MWRFKYLLIGMAIATAIGVVVFFVGRFAFDEIRDEFQQDAVAAVQDGFRANDPGPITQTRIVITEREMTDALQRADASSSAFDEEGLAIDFVPGEIRVVDGSPDGGSGALAVIRPTIVNGRIELGELDGLFGIVLPLDTMADEIETQAANIFNESNVTPMSIEVTDRELIIEVEPKPGTSLATPRASPRPGGATSRPSATPGSTVTPRAARTPPATATEETSPPTVTPRPLRTPTPTT